jgi:hypothetical protein
VAQPAIRSLPGRPLDWPACRDRRGTALLRARIETEWFKICWQNATAILFMARRLTFVKPAGTPCTTSRGERANSGAPPVLVAFGEEDAQKLAHFGYDHGGAFIDSWHLYGRASVFDRAAE